MPYVLQPLVGGELGQDVEFDHATHPPVIDRVQYVLDYPTSEDLMESFPAYIVSEALAERLVAAGLRGFTLAEAEVLPGDNYLALYGDVPHKTYRLAAGRAADARRGRRGWATTCSCGSRTGRWPCSRPPTCPGPTSSRLSSSATIPATVATVSTAATASSRRLPVGIRMRRGRSHQRRRVSGARSGTPPGVHASAATCAR